MVNSEFSIRAATEADARAIAEIHVAGWRAAYQGKVPDALLDSVSVEDRAAMWRQAMARPVHSLLVAEREGRVIGFVSLGPTTDEGAAKDTGEVYAIYVQPDIVGRGVGRVLLARGVEGLKSLGFGRGTLWVLENNARTLRFYEIAGWRPDGTEKVEDWNGFPLREVRYRTEL